jgi:flagellar biosynthesis chaperone FliJ
MKYTQARDLVEAALDVLSEESEKEMSARNIETYQGHIDRLEGAIKHHSSRKPGWSDRYGNQTHSSINAKVKDLTNIHKELTTRHKKALANHASGNYGANRGHYLLNTDWH